MINSTNRTGSTPHIGGIPLSVNRPAPRAADEGDRFSTDSLNRLRQALDQQPSVRPDVIELGRSLASDPAYPPEPIVRKLAALLVNQPADESDAGGEAEKD
jgi:hypothetical protein